MRAVHGLLSIIALALLASALAQSPFEPDAVHVGPLPWCLALGHLNTDGRLDIACSNAGANSMSICLATGRGRFAPAIQVAVPTGSYGTVRRVQIADFDGDGDNDVMLLVDTAGAIMVVRNDGAAGFTHSATIPLTPYPIDLEPGDLNADGILDFAVSLASPARVRILIGLGGGAFTAPIDYVIPGNGQNGIIRVADLDGNQTLDVIAAYSNVASIAVLLNSGAGAFSGPTTYPTGVSAYAITLGEWAGGAGLDAFTATTDGRLQRLRNDGSGGFSVDATIDPPGSTIYWLVSGDIDADGIEDLMGLTSDEMLVWRVDATGTPSTPTIVPSNLTNTLACGDLDGDGLADPLVSRHGDFLQLLASDGEGSFVPGKSHAIESGLKSTAMADLDHDNDVDLVSVRSSSATLVVRLNDGTGDFSSPMTYPASGSPYDVALGYVNSDSNVDAVFSDGSNVRVSFGNGTGAFPAVASQAFFFPGTKCTVEDVTGDGFGDLIFSYSQFTPPNVITRGRGIAMGNGTGAFTLLTSSTTPTDGIAVADFNADGLRDVVLWGSRVQLLTSNGGGNFTLTADVAAPASGSGHRPVAFDMDHDGDLDLVSGYGANAAIVLLGDGQGGLVAGAATTVSGGYGGYVFADFDGDSNLDVLGTPASLYDKAAIYLQGSMTGQMTLRGQIVLQGEATPIGWARDLDGDGRTDLLYCESQLPYFYTYFNRLPVIEPATYCTAKTTSNGCVPSIGWSGSSSAVTNSGFVVSASQVINGKTGMLAYSTTGRQAVPFQGGKLCVRAPLGRTPLTNSNGNPPPDDCSGVFSIDFNAFARGLLGGSPSAALSLPGTAVTTQWWGRDPQALSTTMLSNALDIMVGP